MAKPETPTSTTPDTPTYLLVAEKLGRDPLEFIRERRAQTPPMPFAKIADEIKKEAGVYITHEWPRRWYHRSASEGDAA